MIHVEKNNGRKIYDDSTIHRLRQIKWLREHECSIHEIQELFEQSTIDELLQEKLEEVEQSMIQLYQKKLELQNVIQAKEIPEADPQTNIVNLKTSYMMIVNMDRFMGWLNVCLFVIALLICVLLKDYEVFLPSILVLVILCTFLYKYKLEPTLDDIKRSHDVAISLAEVIIRSMMNFTAHLGISWIILNNCFHIFKKLAKTGEIEFLDVCLIIIGIVPFCMILILSISHNFRYRAFFHK